MSSVDVTEPDVTETLTLTLSLTLTIRIRIGGGTDRLHR